MIDEKSAEEITESFMELPRALLERIKENTEIIKELHTNQERLIELVARLHGFDLDEIRAQIVTEARRNLGVVIE